MMENKITHIIAKWKKIMPHWYTTDISSYRGWLVEGVRGYEAR